MLPFIDAGEAFLRATALLPRGRFSNLAPCFQVTFMSKSKYQYQFGCYRVIFSRIAYFSSFVVGKLDKDKESGFY